MRREPVPRSIQPGKRSFRPVIFVAAYGLLYRLLSAPPTSPRCLPKWRASTQSSTSIYYGDRFVDLIAEGFDCAIRAGYLQDSNLIAKRVGPFHGRLVASPGYIEMHGSPETPGNLVTHQALTQGTETWQFMDGDKIVTVQPQAGSRPTTL